VLVTCGPIAPPRRYAISSTMTPDQCSSLEDVRREIDRIDRDVIALLGRRIHYVEAAARFKTSEQDVAAPERQAAMMRERREWAAEAGLDPDLIEDIYRRLVAYFVRRELDCWRA
jgi:isochorismate pyruvate lyase